MRLRQWAWKPGNADMRGVEEAAQRALGDRPVGELVSTRGGAGCHVPARLRTSRGAPQEGAFAEPYDCHVMALRSPLATYLGKPEEGIEWAMRAMSLYPGHPDWYATQSRSRPLLCAQLPRGRASLCGGGRTAGRRARGTAAARARLGDMAGARAAVRELLKIGTGILIGIAVGHAAHFRHEEDRDHLRQGLLDAGLPR